MGSQREKKIMEHTLRLYMGMMILIFVALFVRIGWLQIIETELYRNKSISNIMRFVPDVAPRGEIVDRNGQVLVSNRPVFNLSLDYLSMQDEGSIDIDDVLQKLVGILDDPAIKVEDIQTMIAAQKNRLYEPIVVKRDIPIELVTTIEERKRELPGVSIDIQPQRSYVYGALAGHLLGYVHSIKEELDQPGFEDYGLADLVGKTGLEKTYETFLRGQNGYKQVEVTAKNKPVRPGLTVPAITGSKLHLTLDLTLQQTMETAFDQTLEKVQKKYPKAKAGAAVLLDVKTGKVLAMTSRPALNPDDFNGKPMNQDQADYYFRDDPTALRNRAIQGSYVPGSIFKPIIALAALESGNVQPLDLVTCTGKYWYSPYIKCTGVHGRQNLYQGMANSCNVFFQEMARRAGMDQISKVGMEFGLGQFTGIDLPFETTGLLPSLDWQQKEFAQRADKINKQIDDKISSIEQEYQPKLINAADEKEKKKLQAELNSKKNIWEQERKIQLAHYTQWHDYDTYNTGIGQGYNQYSIIELANYVATLANGGKRYKPYTVDHIVSPDGSVLKQYEPQLVSTSTVSPLNIKEVQKAMMAVTDPGGTAYSLFKHFPATIKVAAKTGTAQPGRVGYVKNKDYDGLFIAFAPADDPQIAFAGVIEYGWSGSGSIGLVAKALFEQYFGIASTELQPSQASTDQPGTVNSRDNPPPEVNTVPETNTTEQPVLPEDTGTQETGQGTASPQEIGQGAASP